MRREVLTRLDVDQRSRLTDLREPEQQRQSDDGPPQHEITAHRLILNQLRREWLPFWQSLINAPSNGGFRHLVWL